MRLVLLSALLLGIAATGCAPDPLTLEQRMQLLVHMNRRLQMELLERDRRIAELAGGETSARPQTGVDVLRPGEPLVEDPFKPVRITLGRITGGADFDGLPGDDGLRVLIQPEDKFGHTVKRAGALELELFDLAIEGADQCLGRWEFTVEQAVRQWVSAPFGINGYSLEVKWPGGKPPAHAHLTLLVRFTTLEGRPLSTQKDFDVKLPGGPVVPAGAQPPPSESGKGPNLPPLPMTPAPGQGGEQKAK